MTKDTPLPIKRFAITNLHNKKNTVELKFVDNTLILVGENGSGKTTILRCFFYFMTAQWMSLIKIRFAEITIEFEDRSFTISRDDLGMSELPDDIQHQLFFDDDDDNIEIFDVDWQIQKLEHNRFIEERFLNRKKRPKKVKVIEEYEKYLSSSLNFQLLYLPTYRRIEQEIDKIFSWLGNGELKHRIRRHSFEREYSSENKNKFIELTEFGMRDVQQSIKRTLTNISGFARKNLNDLTSEYLTDIIEEKYKNVRIDNVNITQDTIKSVLGRTQKDSFVRKIENSLNKIINIENPSSAGEHDKVILHYFSKLMNFQEKLENEERMVVEFCEKCNSYLTNKKFIYDPINFLLDIYDENNNKNKIELQNLSSGEKQIVSLFSYMYLSEKEKMYFVIIDEPELSLSVPWQKKFLADIKESSFCAGIFSVTHSPFIYENNLKKYARGIGEFYKKNNS